MRRSVDDELVDLCRTGTYAYVLSARQMGKSSLMVQAARSLRDEGVTSVIVDLSQIGTQVDADSWYVGILTMIEGGLGLEVDAFAWWRQQVGMGSTQRLVAFFRDVILPRYAQRIVVFVDEIDTTLSLDFTDDFFAAMRAMSNARAVEPAFERLSFVLIGVATPGDLISDAQRTPFNIGRGVDIGYFTEQEAVPLAEGFDLPPPDARRVLSWVLDWTGGHPYLTQRLCSVVAERARDGVTPREVERAARDTFLGDQSEKDSNLRFVQDMLVRRSADPDAVLDLYRKVLRSGSVADDSHSVVLSHLKLSGIVRSDGPRLSVANRIYAHVFDRRWIDRNRRRHWLRSVPPAVRGLVAASFIALIAIASFIFARLEADRARSEQERAASYNAELVARGDSLRAASREADSLRIIADAVAGELANAFEAERQGRVMLAEANDRLQRSVEAEQKLRGDLQVSVSELEEAVGRNRMLNEQLRAALADERSSTRAMRAMVVSIEARRMAARGEAELAGLLARRALLLSDSTSGAIGDVLLSAMRDAVNALSGRTREPRTVLLTGDTAPVAAVDPGGRDVVAGTSDGAIRRWTVADSLVETHQIQAHAGAITALMRPTTGFDAISGGRDGRVIAWRLPDGEAPSGSAVATVPGGVRALAGESTGRWIVVVSQSGTIRVSMMASVPEGTGVEFRSTVPVRHIALGDDGARIAWSSDDGTVQVQDVLRPESGPVELRTGLESIRALAFRPGRNVLAVAGTGGGIVLWDVSGAPSTWTVLRELDHRTSEYTSLAFDRAGTTLFSGSGDGRVLRWALESPGEAPTLLESGSRRVTGVSVDDQGHVLATAGSDRRLNIWTLDLAELSRRVCAALGTAEISRAAWEQFLGRDRAYLDGGPTCPETTRPMLRSVRGGMP